MFEEYGGVLIGLALTVLLWVWLFVRIKRLEDGERHAPV